MNEILKLGGLAVVVGAGFTIGQKAGHLILETADAAINAAGRGINALRGVVAAKVKPARKAAA